MGRGRRLPGILVRDSSWRPWLFVKGLCMGVADVIPGVSGGTLALILGIYRELVEAVGSLNLRWFVPLVRWVQSGFRGEPARRMARAFRRMNLRFLAWLGAGILTALALGSLVIPPIMADYPAVVRGFFFGLILASVGVPFRMIRGRSARIPLVVLAGIPALIGGYLATSPGRLYLVEPEWVSLRARGETLGELLTRGVSSRPTPRVYWSPENGALRRHVARTQPERARRLRDRRSARSTAGPSEGDPEPVARSDPYDRLSLAEGLTVRVPRLPLWYVFLAAGAAISAMVLPGISGSYVLLVLGGYFFVLNAGRAVLQGIAVRAPPVYALLVLGTFGIGAALGLVSFARLIGSLLARWTDLTVGALVGLMVGCLRGVWPFRRTADGVPVNVLPASVDAHVGMVVVSLFSGCLIVLALTRLGGDPTPSGSAEPS